MHVRDANRYLIHYSSPYEMRLNWHGFMLGISKGWLFYLGESNFTLQTEYSIKFYKRFLSKLTLQGEEQGSMGVKSLRTSSFGFAITVGYTINER